jgi:hypothetical protein
LGTERRLPVSDAEVLAAYRAGESQRALAQRFKVSKGAVQKAIARARARSAEPSPKPNAPASSTRAHATRPLSSLDIRERLEHEALNARDSRTRLSALKMLHELDGEKSAPSTAEQTGFYFGRTSMVLEPVPKRRIRLWRRTEGGWDQVGTYPREQAFLIVCHALDLENAEQPPMLAGVQIRFPRQPTPEQVAEKADDEPEAEEPQR